MTDVIYAPPNPEAAKIVPIPVPTDPAAKALVDNLNQTHQELARAQKENAEAIGADLSEMNEKTVALNASFEETAEAVANLDGELQRLRQASIARDAVGAGTDSPSGDPRDDAAWSLALDSFFRQRTEMTDEERTALGQGNRFHEIMESATATQRSSPDFDPVAAVQSGGLSTLFGPGAGVWARPEYDAEITKLLVEFSPIRGFTRVTVINAAEFVGTFRTADRDTVEQVREGSPGTQQTQFNRYTERRIKPFIYKVRPALTDEQLEDAVIDLEAEVLNDVGVDFAADEASLFTIGSGANEPLGYAADDEVTGVTTENSGVISHKDLLELALSLRPFYRQNGAFAFSTDAFRAAILLEDSQGRRLWQPAVGEGLPSLYSGWPYFESVDQADIVASSKSVFFADWRQFYRIVDRRGIKITRDETTQDGIVILTHSRRFGGRTWKTEAGRALTTKA